MKLLISPYNDPYLNLATEEFLLKSSDEDFTFIYVNKPCVVVGKHQIAQKEINSNFIYENNVLLARRLSGGGTVYHDEGNLNFSYIQSVPPGGSISYRDITQSIFEFLKGKVPGLQLSERNDLLLEGKKVSGSAMHVYKNRVIAHGTLLIDCNLQNLSMALKANQERFSDKSIVSRKSVVMNLSSENSQLTINSIIKDFSLLLSSRNKAEVYHLPKSSLLSIQLLSESKYATKDWIFDYSPKYTYNSNFAYKKKVVKYKLEVVKGSIVLVAVEQPDDIDNSLILNILQGKKHNYNDLRAVFKNKRTGSFEKGLFDSLF